jgi:hypothetical protein
MQQKRVTKEEFVDLFNQWRNMPVRVHVFSHGVGVIYKGYLDFAYKETPSTGQPLPDFALLYREPREQMSAVEIPKAFRAETPIIVVKFDDFSSFEIIEDDSRRLATLANNEARVLIERSHYESA